MNKNLGTLLHGIASSNHLDSSGERIDIKGLDISSLTVDGTYTWEHKNENSSQVVGKILEAKKIFSEEDCENEHHLYFWNKCKAPYVYVMGELFDKVGHENAKDIVAMLNYDLAARQAGRPAKNTINFSVEGSKLDTQGSDIKRSIARKITLTILPCNKQAIAELMPQTMDKSSQQKNSLLKSESYVELLKGYGGSAVKNPSGLWTMSPSAEPQEPVPAPKQAPKQIAPKPIATAPAPAPKTIASPIKNGSVIGQTKSGKDVFSHNQARDYAGFSSQDHADAMNHHYDISVNTNDYKAKNHHLNAAKFHSAFRNRKEDQEKRTTTDMKARHGIVKSDVAPSQKVNGDALMKEKIEGVYKTFAKKDVLEKHIAETYPELNKHQVIAISKMVVFRKEKELEEILKSIIKA